jgi:O-Antigen ligase
MTSVSVGLSRQRRGTVGQLRRLLLILFVGSGIGAIVGLGLYATKVVDVALLPIGLAVLVPPLFLKDFRRYWLVVFLLSLELPFTKNLNDGLAVVQRLHIDYTIWNFTFDITLSDLVLVVLLVIWINDWMFHGRRLRFPAVTWLAIGCLCVCLLSTVGAASPYLGFVELSRQLRFFIMFLYAVNCIDAKRDLRTLAILAVVILVTQAGVTALRFVTGYMTPLTLGHSYENLSQIEQYLAVDRTQEGSLVRAMGTLASPGSTVRLCMMVIPFALFLCARNAMFKVRLPFLALTLFGLAGLVLTFTRVFYITTAIQVALAFVLMLRDRMLSRREAVAVVVALGLGAAAVAPKLYEQFTVREDSVSVRFLQYETALKMIRSHPWLGVGLNNGTGEKPKYTNMTYNPADPNTEFYLEPTHNVYLSLTSEIGIFGALLFFGFFGRVTAVAWRQSRRATDPEIRLIANMMVVTFCGVAVNGLMDPLFEYPVLMLLWLYAGVTLNLPRIAGAQQSAGIERSGPAGYLMASPLRSEA